MRFFAGQGTDLGTVTALPFATFEDLCDLGLSVPVQLQLTREEYHALPGSKEKSAAKRVRYLTPAAFGSSPSKRVTAQAVRCNLVALDIDDAAEASRLLSGNWAQALRDYGFVAYHTASSTPEAPRIRVLVSAEGILPVRYSAAVQTVADMLGLTTVTRESMVPVQPMFWPTVFKGETASPIIACNMGGDALTDTDLVEPVDNPTPPSPAEPGLGDLAFLRSPMDGITLADAIGALEVLDPDMPMQSWIEVACALKHQFGDSKGHQSQEALQAWDSWSSKGKKYPGSDELAYRWGTLKAQPTDRAPVTIRSLFRMAQARGWTNETLTKKAYVDQLAWLTSPARSSEELLDQGVQRIASVASTVGLLEKKSLMTALRKKLHDFGHDIGITDIRRDVRRIEVEATRQAGVPSWAKGIVFVTAVNKFYRSAVDRAFTPEVLDLMYSSPAVAEDKPVRPRDYLIQFAGVSQVENLRYEPRMADKVVFTEKGVPYVNTYKATFAKPNAEGAQEAGDLFMGHMQRLVAEDEHRATLVDFLTFLVQRPGEKIRWATLLQGGMGCGKTFLAVAMKAVLGSRNVRKLTATDVMEGTSNGWAYGQQLIVLEEVRIVGQNRFGVMDKLKPCISDDDISLRELYQGHRTVPNICNYLMFTNHHDSLAVHDDDRRYFVLQSPLQQPEDIAGLGAGYFEKLYGMVRDNAGGLRAWFEERTIGKSFSPDGRAPVTKYLHELVEAAASPLTSTVQQTIEDQPHALVRRDLLSLGCLRGCMDHSNLPLFTDQALAAVLRELGWRREGRHMIEGARHSLWTKGLRGDAGCTAQRRLEIL